MLEMDWTKVYFGHVSPSEVQKYIADDEWQKVRLSMKGVSTEQKYRTLCRYIDMDRNDRARQVRVTNYVTALSRGGLIKPSDYR